MATTTNDTQDQVYTKEDFTDFAHTGPGTLAGRFMRSFWQPVHVGRKLEKGRAITIKIMSQEYLLYRGASGEVHLLDPRCAHRSTLLSTGWVEDDCVRCFYHGWAYDGTGQCVDQPAEQAEFAKRVKIRSYPVEEYLGFIFAYLGEGEPPPLPRYPEFEGDKGMEASMIPRNCNYFQNVENSVDEVHLAFTHRSIAPLSETNLNRDVPVMTAEERDYGAIAIGTRTEGDQRVQLLIMPNAFLDEGAPVHGVKARQINLVWRVPIDDENHLNCNWRYLDVTGEDAARYNAAWQERERIRDNAPSIGDFAEAILAGKLRWEDIEIDNETMDRFKMIQVQDWVVMAGQGRIVDRAQERLGRSDRAIILLRRLWAREMQALGEGRPLKQWTRPGIDEVQFGGV